MTQQQTRGKRTAPQLKQKESFVPPTPTVFAPKVGWDNPMHPAPSQNLSSVFGMDFQGMLLRTLVEDPLIAKNVGPHIKPHYFQNPVMAWAWDLICRYQSSYNSAPTWPLLLEWAHTLPPEQAPIHTALLEKVRQTPITDEGYLRDRAIDFIQKNIFRQTFADVRELFQAGNVSQAYDEVRRQMDKIDSVAFEKIDRGWIAEGFADRMAERTSLIDKGSLLPTGIPRLDEILGGGAYPSFLGTWLAYPKAGKTSILTNLGVMAMRVSWKKNLHIVLEGSRAMVESRYDAVLTDELYSSIKRGDIDAKKYAHAVQELKYLRQLGVIRGFTENWDTNILHIDAELNDLRRAHGWKPEQIIIDYGDLLRPRIQQQGETQNQIEAFKDMKALANRGYVIWTASQVRRPDFEEFDTTPHTLRSKDIADAYGKVRICDFIGSINQCLEERKRNEMRLYAEMFRDGPAHEAFTVNMDFQKMTLSTAQVQNPFVQPAKALISGKELANHIRAQKKDRESPNQDRMQRPVVANYTQRTTGM